MLARQASRGSADAAHGAPDSAGPLDGLPSLAELSTHLSKVLDEPALPSLWLALRSRVCAVYLFLLSCKHACRGAAGSRKCAGSLSAQQLMFLTLSRDQMSQRRAHPALQRLGQPALCCAVRALTAAAAHGGRRPRRPLLTWRRSRRTTACCASQSCWPRCATTRCAPLPPRPRAKRPRASLSVEARSAVRRGRCAWRVLLAEVRRPANRAQRSRHCAIVLAFPLTGTGICRN